MPQRCSPSSGECRWPADRSAILEAESGFNDPPVVVLVALVTSPAWGSQSWPVTLAMIALQLAGGLLIGLAAGAIGEQLLRRLALPAVGLYPITVFAITMLAYAAGSVLQVSGLLAVYVASLWLGNTGSRISEACVRSPTGWAGWPRSGCS